MQGKIIKSAVEALKDGILWDAKLTGFGVRARGGRKQYFFKCRVAGKQRWIAIGEHGRITAKAARAKAEELQGDLAAGREPGKPDRGEMTVEKAVEGFIEAHCQHLRSHDSYARLMQRHVSSRWGNKKLSTITQSDVVKLLEDLQGRDKTKRIRIANRVRCSLMRFFKWAKSEALYKAPNPVADTEPRRGAKARTRVLTDEEIRAIWNASTDFTFGAIVRILMITGQRRTEVGGMCWSELDLERGMWTLPAARHKSARGHTVPLTPTVVALIQEIPKRGEALFSVKITGFNNWSMAKNSIDTVSNTSMWTLHDIRRTVSTEMEKMGISPYVIAAVLGHSKSVLAGITSIYLRSTQESEKRIALEAWEKRLLEIIGGGIK